MGRSHQGPGRKSGTILPIVLGLAMAASGDNWNTATAGAILSPTGTKIGIGMTTAPAGILEVRPSPAGSGAGLPVILSAQQGAANNAGGNLILNSGPNGTGSPVNGDIRFGIGGTINYSNGTFTNGEKMRIHSDGTVGVGGDLGTDGFALSANSSQMYKQFRVRATGTGNNGEPLIKFSGGYYGGNGAELWQRQSGDVLLNINGGKVGLIISESGNVGVGIGATVPSHKLQVGGSAKFDGEIEVAGIRTRTWTVAPDYVFEKDYKLASLGEVDAFVQKHKHLPEVPSAKTIQEKGLDLAEMNLLLLKKVEELTLHAIRQEKRMKNQENEMRKQAEEIRSLKSRNLPK